MSAKASDRFWAQDVDGNVAGTGADNHGITVQPMGLSTTDLNLAPGRILTIIGTVVQLNGSNLTLLNATYTIESLTTPYNGKDSNRDSLNVLTEKYEGMYVRTAGRASTTAAVECQDYDFCIVTCDRTTPVVLSIDASATQIQINRDHNFDGIVEGTNTGTYPYSYWVLDAQEGSDACL
ncbi:MAG: hypothetical protein ACT4TC_18145 [Myxococcaceae bacterium]